MSELSIKICQGLGYPLLSELSIKTCQELVHTVTVVKDLPGARRDTLRRVLPVLPMKGGQLCAEYSLFSLGSCKPVCRAISPWVYTSGYLPGC